MRMNITLGATGLAGVAIPLVYGSSPFFELRRKPRAFTRQAAPTLPPGSLFTNKGLPGTSLRARCRIFHVCRERLTAKATRLRHGRLPDIPARLRAIPGCPVAMMGKLPSAHQTDSNNPTTPCTCRNDRRTLARAKSHGFSSRNKRFAAVFAIDRMPLFAEVMALQESRNCPIGSSRRRNHATAAAFACSIHKDSLPKASQYGDKNRQRWQAVRHDGVTFNELAPPEVPK